MKSSNSPKVEGVPMSVSLQHQRILLAARPTETEELRALFCEIPLQRWDILEADSCERARSLLQKTACDILLVDESLCQGTSPGGLSWVPQQSEPPTILLTGMDPDAMARAYEMGVSMCLPRRVCMCNPQMLAAAIKRVLQVSELQQVQRRTAERLLICRRQVDRLVSLLWRTIPMDSNHQWFTHKHAVERLQEEVARCGRHGDVFTVALAEVEKDQTAAKDAQEPDDLTEWASAVVSRTKRRCDIAGFYGLRGFMLLMVQTPHKGGLACCRRLQTKLLDAAQKSNSPRGPIRASFGLSTFSPDNATSEVLLGRAEKHLQVAKAGAGGGIVAD